MGCLVTTCFGLQSREKGWCLHYLLTLVHDHDCYNNIAIWMMMSCFLLLVVIVFMIVTMTVCFSSNIDPHQEPYAPVLTIYISSTLNASTLFKTGSDYFSK